MATNRIRELRKDAGFNQKELGDKLGVGQTTVSAWEIGRNEPDNECCHKMAKLFGCSIGYLMGFEAESEHRGLSDEEWYAFTRQRYEERQEKQFKHEMESESFEELTKEEMQEWIEYSNVDEWEKSGRMVHWESIQIDAILDRQDEAGRKKALEMIRLLFS